MRQAVSPRSPIPYRLAYFDALVVDMYPIR